LLVFGLLNLKNTFRYTGYFTSDNEFGGIENATHNTLERKPEQYSAFPPVVLWVAFLIHSLITRELYPVFMLPNTFLESLGTSIK
jgi:hypothetical protein